MKLTASGHVPVPLKEIRVDDAFWSRYAKLVHETVIPYQWEALNDRIPDAAPSYAMRNFRVAAGKDTGEFGGFVFQDSDFAKWLEAVGYTLATHPDPELERLADEAIDVIADAQHEDGYLNTYYTIKAPGERWTNLTDCHELYCAGHMIEAAVAYYLATGKKKLLWVVCRLADHIDSVFGTEPGKIRGYCGHQEIELALVKLYEVTGEERYMRLSQYFIDERGSQPNFFIEEWERRGRTSHWGPKNAPNPAYHQSHLPVREQTEAVGHAVRAVYMYSAMADLARLTGDEGLLRACRTLWRNVTARQMYITGGIGSTHHGEAFSFDYDLPNDTVYAETCASIGLIFFAHRMLRIEADRDYADVLERALYNNVIASMSLDGKHYFYVNPLEVWPEASERNPGRRHVKPVRQKWFGCSCCPPNVARLLASLGQYIYTVQGRTVYTHLFIGGEAKVDLDGSAVVLRQQTDYPWNGAVKLRVSPSGAAERFTLALRLPGWCEGEAELRINGEAWKGELPMAGGYVRIDRSWQEGDEVEWVLPMPAQLVEAHPLIRANAGKVAIQRGPLVYCLEETDHGSPLTSYTLARDAELTVRWDAGLLGGAMVIEGEGFKQDADAWGDALYRPIRGDQGREPVRIRAVPYFLWGNRQPGEMTVWVRPTD